MRKLSHELPNDLRHEEIRKISKLKADINEKEYSNSARKLTISATKLCFVNHSQNIL